MLAPDRALVVSGFGDVCEIKRDVAGDHNDTVDGRGRPVSVGPEPETVYGPDVDPYNGACSIVSSGKGSRQQGGAESADSFYIVELPWDAPQVRVGDTVKMTASRDPQLQDHVLTVFDVPAAGSRTIVRRVRAREGDLDQQRLV